MSYISTGMGRYSDVSSVGESVELLRPERPDRAERRAGSPACRIRTVTVWLNAFIPRLTPGHIVIPRGPHSGKTAICATPRLGPVPPNACYLTDQRGFNATPGASSRITSEITYDLATRRVSDRQVPGVSTLIETVTGRVLCHRTVSITRVRVTGRRILAAGRRAEVDLKAATENACLPPGPLNPDLDYEGTVIFDFTADPSLGSGFVEFNGAVDEYPAYEMYVSVNGGPGIEVFRLPPTTLARMLGPPSRRITRRVRIVCPAAAAARIAP